MLHLRDKLGNVSSFKEYKLDVLIKLKRRKASTHPARSSSRPIAYGNCAIALAAKSGLCFLRANAC